MSRPIYKNIEGTPFYLGAQVQVIGLTDETGDEKLVGQIGRIVYYEYECCCGQVYPGQPMIGVKLAIGSQAEEFWPEELCQIPAR